MFDNAGNLYASNFNTNTIEKFTPSGARSVFATTGVNGPEGLAFDSAGDLYVKNFRDNTIEKFNPDGIGSVFASSGLSGAGNLAFTDNFGVPLKLINQVPEPSAFALLGFTSLVLGFFRARRM